MSSQWRHNLLCIGSSTCYKKFSIYAAAGFHKRIHVIIKLYIPYIQQIKMRYKPPLYLQSYSF